MQPELDLFDSMLGNLLAESPDEEASGPPTEIDDTTTKSNMGLKSDGVPEESMSATNSH